MNCNTCHSPFVARRTDEDGEHTYECSRGLFCPERLTAKHRSAIWMRDDWWFASGYSLSFRRNDNWFIAWGKGPHRPDTILLKLTTTPIRYVDVFRIPYMALPVNNDFEREFNVLLSKFDRYFEKLFVLEDR